MSMRTWLLPQVAVDVVAHRVLGPIVNSSLGGPSSAAMTALEIVRGEDGTIDVDAWDELVQGSAAGLVSGSSAADIDID